MKRLICCCVSVMMMFVSVFAETVPQVWLECETVNKGMLVSSVSGKSCAEIVGEAESTPGIVGNGVRLSGKNNYLKIDKKFMSERSEASYCVWVKSEDLSKLMPVMFLEDGFCLSVGGGAVELKIGGSTERLSVDIRNNSWISIVVTVNAKKLKVFVNGEETLSQGLKTSINLKNSLYIGTDFEVCSMLDTDEIELFDRELAASEIRDKYYAQTNKITEWEYVEYPLKEKYPKGIENAKTDNFGGSKYERPIETGFESRNEINAIKTENFGEQLAITEKKYEGKFALEINKKNSEIIPIKTSRYFKLSDDAVIPKKVEKSEETKENEEKVYEDWNITVRVSDKTVTIAGTGTKTTDAAVLVSKNGEIFYVDQTKLDENRDFRFVFPLTEYGNYSLKIGGCYDSAFETELVLHPKSENSEKPVAVKTKAVENIETKCNVISLMIKPMFAAETISFYTKCLAEDEKGTQTEKYVLIKGDKDKDGVFKVGEDLARGKWQSVELDLTNISGADGGNVVSGIYISANDGSRWLFDNIGSAYRNITKNDFNLESMESYNVKKTENGLTLISSGGTEKADNFAIAGGSINISDKITGINVDAASQSSAKANETVSEVVADISIEREDWQVNDVNYSSQNEAVSRKVNQTIADSNGSSATYSVLELKKEGSATLNIGNAATDDRVLISFDSACMTLNTYLSRYIKIELYEEGFAAPYYSTVRTANVNASFAQTTAIVPKLRSNTIIKLSNMTDGEKTANIIRIKSLKVLKVTDEDLYGSVIFEKTVAAEKMQNANFTKCSVSELCGDENKYAVKSIGLTGVVNNLANAAVPNNTHIGKANIFRIINLSNEAAYINVNGERCWLGYGEFNLSVPATTSVSFPKNDKVMVLANSLEKTEMASYKRYEKTRLDGLAEIYHISKNGKNIYYANGFDYNRIYRYNIESGETTKVSDIIPESKLFVSDDEGMLVTQSSDKKIYFINLKTNESETVESNQNLAYAFFSPQNECVYNLCTPYSSGSHNIQYSLYTHSNDEKSIYYVNLSTAASADTYQITVSFDKKSEKMLISDVKGACLYKKYNGKWNKIKDIDITRKAALTDDGSMIFNGLNETDLYDIASGTKRKLTGIGFLSKIDDNTLIVGSESQQLIYYVDENITSDYFNKISGYNPISKTVFGVEGDCVFRKSVEHGEPEMRFALSFDGKKNWYSYKNGRWIVVSSGMAPNAESLKTTGMTVKEINEIPTEAFTKLYKNGDEILTVDISALMYESYNGGVPIIKSITVDTLNSKEGGALYGTYIERYDKAEYNAVSSVFPIEDMPYNTECYYLLYIGNDWLYTYKNGKIAKTVESASELLGNMSDNWISFKQYGMTASELRAVPSEVLSKLLVNPDYANTEFGIIYALKTNGSTTENCKVKFRLKTESKYITDENVIIEIVMNGNETKTISSADFGKAEIEKFIAWIEARQNGSGNSFYRLKGNNVQYFINYYMINSINVYEGDSYPNPNN